MGLIAQRVAAVVGEIRNDSGWLTRDDDEMGPVTPAGVRVTSRAALGLTTVWRCVDLLTSAVAMSPKDVIVKVGGQSFPEYSNRPAWLSMPNPADPTYTADDYFAQVALSLLLDGNYFVHVFPNVLDPQVLTVLHPGRITVKPGPRYELKNAAGQVVNTFGPMEMLHGTWLRPAGELRGISPLETLKRGIGAAIAAEEHAARFFGQGASLAFGVEVPYALDKAKQDDLRDSLKSKYAGLRNSHAIGVLSEGAKFVSGLAPTPEQAQMLDTRKFSVEDLCRPFGVPPGMAGSQQPGASSYASAEVYDNQFKERGVLPLAVRMELQHTRLLQVPAGITDPSASVQFKFNLDAVARVNLLNRYQGYAAGVQGGFITPNEARGKEDLPPIKEGGDQLYMQQQMVPLSVLGQTKATEPLVTQPAPAGGRSDAVVINFPETRSAEAHEVHYHAGPITNEIRTPDQPAPVVQNTVNVAPTPIANTVNVPESVNVVNVTTPEQRPVTKTVRRLDDGAYEVAEVPDGE